MMFFSNNKHTVAISPSIVVFTFVFALSVYLLSQVQGILVALFLSFIVMTALRPAVDKLHRMLRIPRPLAILIVYLMMILTIGLLIAVVLPPLLVEGYNFLKSIQIPFLQQEVQNLSLSVQEASQLLSQVGDGANLVFSLIASTFNGLFAFFTLMVMSFYIMMDRDNLHKKISWFTRDKKHLQIAENFLNSLETQLGGWIRGQALLMLIIGVITYFGMSILHVPFALPLAIIAGMLEILPNLGPTVAAVPAIILALLNGGPVLALMTTIFYILVQQLENNLIVPKIMQASADVNPLVAIVTILTGFRLGGVVGALLGIPLYIVLRSTYTLIKENNIKLF